MFRCESKSTLFGFPHKYTTRNEWASYIYNTVLDNIRVYAAHFTAYFPGRE